MRSNSLSSPPFKSHLFSTIITPRLNSLASPAMRSSSSFIPSTLSRTSTAISAFSSIFCVRFSAYFSMPSILPRRRMPAVSTNSISRSLLPSFTLIFSFTGSIVVPAISLTTERFCPTSAFSRLDLPTFTLPIMPTFIVLFS